MQKTETKPLRRYTRRAEELHDPQSLLQCQKQLFEALLPRCGSRQLVVPTLTIQRGNRKCRGGNLGGRTAASSARDGRTESLILGQAVGQENSGYYAMRGDTAEVFIVPSSTYQTLTDTAAKFKLASASTATAPTQP